MLRFSHFTTATVLLLGSWGCGSPDGETSIPDAGSHADAATDAVSNDTTLGDARGIADAVPSDTACNPVEAEHPSEGNAHVPLCSPVTFGTNPPSSGSHYPVWADYKTYATTFSRGFWVHSLEHGAVVLTYNCPEGCAAEIAAAQALIDALPPDTCGAGFRRIMLLPDPELDVRFAASAWGFTLKARCFDRAAFAAFIEAHTDHAPESVCGGGQDPTGGVGGMPICP